MMQSYASLAKLQGGGPILNRGFDDHVHYRVAATSDHYLHLGSSDRVAENPCLISLSFKMVTPPDVSRCPQA